MRHGLEALNVMTDDGAHERGGRPLRRAGSLRVPPQRSWPTSRREGLLVKVEPYHHAVGTCQRCDTDIEPRISTQWFVSTKPLAEAAMQAVRDGRTRIIPDA